jgi:hypothetical protein
MGVLIACVIAVIVTTFNAVQVQRVEAHQKQQQANLGRQFQQLVQACVRLNILRAEDNVSHFADYKVFKAVYTESRLAQKISYATAVRIEGAKLANRERSLNQSILTPIKSAVDLKAWTPLTNCAKAVSQDGPFYRPPKSILFITRLPPRADLSPQG